MLPRPRAQIIQGRPAGDAPTRLVTQDGLGRGRRAGAILGVVLAGRSAAVGAGAVLGVIDDDGTCSRLDVYAFGDDYLRLFPRLPEFGLALAHLAAGPAKLPGIPPALATPFWG